MEPAGAPEAVVSAARELYGLPPEDFTARRGERRAALRAAGDRDAAAAVGALRRPTVTAWLVNLLVRDGDGGATLASLDAVGEQLRDAQRRLDATRLRELDADRRALSAALLRRARDLRGQGLGSTIERELTETFAAAAADPGAAAAVRSGSLVRALSYTGFGDVDLSAAVAVRAGTRRAGADQGDPAAGVADGGPHGRARRQASGQRDQEAREQRDRDERERRDRDERERREREARARRAQEAAHAAQVAADEARAEAERLAAEVTDLQERLDAAREAAREAAAVARRAAAEARRRSHAAERAP